MSKKEYDRVVEQWKAIDDRTEGEAYYRREVFPRSCERVRALAPTEAVELFLVPVGTQAYPPILTCIGTPAQRVVLLHSRVSESYAEEVREALRRPDGPEFHFVLIDELNPLDIAQKMRSCYDTFGQPPADQVVCDQTGGNKVMTATIAGFAALNGWSQVYVQSKYMRDRVGSYDEEVLLLPNLFRALGGYDRALAWRLAGLGHFEAALPLLQQAIRESLASAADEVVARRFRLAAAYRKANLAPISRSLKKLARALGEALPRETVIAIAGEHDRNGFYYWVSKTLHREGQTFAAVTALRLTGEDVDAQTLAPTLRKLEKERREAWSLAAWRPVDELLGYPYSRLVRSSVTG